MSFNSIEFLIFLPLVILVYFLLPHKVRWVWLLAASYYAYMSWDAVLILLILATTIVSYVSGIIMERTSDKKVRKILLIITLMVCLGILAFFKYGNFLIKSVTDFLNLFRIDLDPITLNLILPVGISFYTFQTLSYVIDVYRGNIMAEKHFGYYALFVSFFPQLVAGPIERPQDLLPQLKSSHKFSLDDFSVGVRFMVSGFFRKCVIADNCGVFVDSVFGNIGQANTLALLAAIFLFAAQIYCDFAGYSEIAVGAARIMGIKLTRNFDRPYSATDIGDLMRRWHITLSSWFKDYLYIPLGGSRNGIVRHLLNILIVYTLSGLWHGADWTYVLWGLYVGVLICLNTVTYKPVKKLCGKLKTDMNGKLYRGVRRTLMFFEMIFSVTFFRSESISQAGEVIKRLFTGFGFGIEYFKDALAGLGMDYMDIILVLIILSVQFFLYEYSEFNYLKTDADEGSLVSLRDKSSYGIRTLATYYGILIIAVSWIMLASQGSESAFVYFQF